MSRTRRSGGPAPQVAHEVWRVPHRRGARLHTDLPQALGARSGTAKSASAQGGAYRTPVLGLSLNRPRARWQDRARLVRLQAVQTDSRTIRVVLCDDHVMVREGLKKVIDGVDGIVVVASASDGEEGVEATVRLRPDVVLMDLAMPGVDGVEATRRIATEAP